MARRNDLKSLRQMIGEAHDILRTTTLPERRSERADELLTAALHLADNLLHVVVNDHRSKPTDGCNL